MTAIKINSAKFRVYNLVWNYLGNATQSSLAILVEEMRRRLGSQEVDRLVHLGPPLSLSINRKEDMFTTITSLTLVEDSNEPWMDDFLWTCGAGLSEIQDVTFKRVDWSLWRDRRGALRAAGDIFMNMSTLYLTECKILTVSQLSQVIKSFPCLRYIHLSDVYLREGDRYLPNNTLIVDHLTDMEEQLDILVRGQ